MTGAAFCDFSLWWIFPIVMIILCFFMMRGRSGYMSESTRAGMCGFGSHGENKHVIRESNSAMEILEKRYALGEIDREEYEEKKKELTRSG